ncbi:RDD family protein [Tumebacillus sp. DT12]|uniref:RDD family protein n=1 Tax=Tumebacillus lacus TaxID=2995335 RepID=A0ABT3X1E2_9BACL|nr:RDD family protein [Tumebacillus lacus]MCX7570736.1 RDD family protein [Tumebacillus lacus]
MSTSYAGFWLRFGAVIIDWILMGLVNGVLRGMTGDEFLYSVLTLLTGWLYYALMESSAHQATLGKKVIGIRVTDLDGNRIGFGRATGRHFGKIISAILLLIGYIMAAFTEKKQALHDILAGTLVVKR